MRYLDGELPPSEEARVRERLDASTELRRELAIYREMKADLQGLSFRARIRRDSVWDRVSRRLARPVGWLFLVGGTAVWIGYGLYVFATSQVNPVEKMATGAVVVGVLLLLATVIWERWIEWQTDPYRDVHR